MIFLAASKDDDAVKSQPIFSLISEINFVHSSFDKFLAIHVRFLLNNDWNIRDISSCLFLASLSCAALKTFGGRAPVAAAAAAAAAASLPSESLLLLPLVSFMYGAMMRSLCAIGTCFVYVCKCLVVSMTTVA